jgi:hypothetical protein
MIAKFMTPHKRETPTKKQFEKEKIKLALQNRAINGKIP